MPLARRQRMMGAAAFILPFVLYAVTAHRFVGYWDVGEMDTVPYILGIAHPPGLALYTLAGFCFSHVFALGSVAMRMSLLSSVCMSAASWCIFAIVRSLRTSDAGALVAALLFASGGIAWNVATRADVHAMEAALFAASLLGWISWYATPRRRTLYAASMTFGLAVATHPIALFLLPPMLVLVIARLHEIETLPLLIAALCALGAAALPQLYLPLRSAAVTAHHLDPVAALGMPGTAFWDYGHPATLGNLARLLFASDVNVSGGLHGYASDAFFDRVGTTLHRFLDQVTVLGLAVAAFGLWRLCRSQLAVALALLIAGAGPVFFSAGFSDESDPGRYLLPSLAIACVFAGCGIGSIRNTRLRMAGVAAVFAVAAIALPALPGRLWNASDRSALHAADVILRRTPPDAIIVADWIFAPPLAYRAYVDNAAGDRTIVPAWYFEVEDRLPSWSARRPVYVAGTPEGSVAGFRLERLSPNPSLYHVEREAAHR